MRQVLTLDSRKEEITRVMDEQQELFKSLAASNKSQNPVVVQTMHNGPLKKMLLRTGAPVIDRSVVHRIEEMGQMRCMAFGFTRAQTLVATIIGRLKQLKADDYWGLETIKVSLLLPALQNLQPQLTSLSAAVVKRISEDLSYVRAANVMSQSCKQFHTVIMMRLALTGATDQIQQQTQALAKEMEVEIQGIHDSSFALEGLDGALAACMAVIETIGICRDQSRMVDAALQAEGERKNAREEFNAAAEKFSKWKSSQLEMASKIDVINRKYKALLESVDLRIAQSKRDLPEKPGCLKIRGTPASSNPVEAKYLKAWNEMDTPTLVQMGNYQNNGSGFSVIWHSTPTLEQDKKYAWHAEMVSLKAETEQKRDEELAQSQTTFTLLEQTGPAIEREFQNAKKAFDDCQVQETETMTSLKLQHPRRHAQVMELIELCHNVMQAVNWMSLAKGGGKNPLKPALKHLVEALKSTERENCAAMIFLLQSAMTSCENSVCGMMAEFGDTFLARFMQADDMKEEEASQWREDIMDRPAIVTD